MKSNIFSIAVSIFAVTLNACGSNDPQSDESTATADQSFYKMGGDGRYDFPILNRFLATIGTGLSAEFGVGKKKTAVDHYFRENHHYRIKGASPFLDPDSASTFVQSYKIPVEIMIQEDPEAPLLFVFPGAGSDYRGGSAQVVAEYFYGLGYHVIISTSTINHRFVLGASRNVVAGDFKEDASDFYDLAVSLKQRAERDHGIRPVKSGIIGLSLGGYFGAKVMELDKRRRQLDISRAYLVNPPIDVEYSMEQVDTFYLNSQNRLNFGARLKHSLSIIRSVLTKNLDRQRSDPDSFASALKSIGEKASNDGHFDEKMQHIISLSFRRTLSKVLCTAWESSTYRGKARHVCQNGGYNTFDVSFREYLDGYVYPSLEKKGVSIRENRRLYSMEHLERFLRRSDDIYLVSNADDPIHDARHVRFMRRTFGDRAQIFPHGGHLGNIWWPENLCNVEKVFEDITPPTDDRHQCGHFDFR